MAWPQFIQGFAVACFFMPLTTITLSGLPPERLAAASSLSNFTRSVAGDYRHVDNHDHVDRPASRCTMRS